MNADIRRIADNKIHFAVVCGNGQSVRLQNIPLYVKNTVLFGNA